MIGRLNIALLGLVAAIGAYELGTVRGVASEKGAQARIALAKAEAIKPLQSKLDQATANHFAALNDRAAAFREIRHETQTILERPVYRNVCIDADGVRLLDRAADIANGRADLAGTSGPPAGTAEGPEAGGRDGGGGGVPDQR